MTSTWDADQAQKEMGALGAHALTRKPPGGPESRGFKLLPCLVSSAEHPQLSAGLHWWVPEPILPVNGNVKC